MPQNTQDLTSNIVWIDLEMTGLDTLNDTIIEIATVITDGTMNIIATGPVFAISHNAKTLAKMDEWNTKTHGESGLIQRIADEGVSLTVAENETLAFIKKYTKEKTALLAGNSICQDRRFLFREMPKLEQYFHYRNFDVSTIKELAKRFRPDLYNAFEKKEAHTALADIMESIAEIQYYRDNFLKLQ